MREIDPRRFVMVETGIATTMSAVMSLIAAVAVFGRATVIRPDGPGGLAVDTIVQSFMVALMIALVGTALTRRRRRRGLRFPGMVPSNLVPVRGLIARALSVGAAIGITIGLPMAGGLSLWGGVWTFPGVLLLKLAIAIGIAVPLTPPLVRQAMTEPLAS